MRIICFDGDRDLPVSATEIVKGIEKLVRNESGEIEGEIRIIMTDDEHILTLNKAFLKHDYPTDVLSFPFSKSKDHIEGEVYISCDRALEQAQQYQNTYEEELWRLTIHGTLHLLGFDDQDKNQKIKMSKKETFYIRACREGVHS